MKYPYMLTQTEEQFQKTVIEHATFRRWRIFFIPDWVWKLIFAAIRKGEKRRKEYWSKPGFPDLVMVRPPRLIFAELKREGEKPREDQWDWLNDLSAVPGIEVYFWTPSCWDDIEGILDERDGADI